MSGPWCPVTDCTNFKKPEHMLCPECYNAVPKRIRDRVWKYWRARRRGDRAAIKLHQEAVADAIEAARHYVATRREVSMP